MKYLHISVPGAFPTSENEPALGAVHGTGPGTELCGPWENANQSVGTGERPVYRGFAWATVASSLQISLH